MKRASILIYFIALAGAAACGDGTSPEIDGCGNLVYIDGGCVFPDAGDAGTDG